MRDESGKKAQHDTNGAQSEAEEGWRDGGEKENGVIERLTTRKMPRMRK